MNTQNNSGYYHDANLQILDHLQISHNEDVSVSGQSYITIKIERSGGEGSEKLIIGI